MGAYPPNFIVRKKGNCRTIHLEGVTDVYGGTYRDFTTGKFRGYLADGQTGKTLTSFNIDAASRQTVIDFVKQKLINHQIVDNVAAMAIESNTKRVRDAEYLKRFLTLVTNHFGSVENLREETRETLLSVPKLGPKGITILAPYLVDQGIWTDLDPSSNNKRTCKSKISY